MGSTLQQNGPYFIFELVAQLVRASPCHGEGRGIEARQVRQFILADPQGVGARC